ncbi:EAL domain-containing protein [Pseudoalteromonas phenolica O-BC30]|nr:EAL domain-containing protein [Pseudoalteromonas phenolica O-BC30]
MPRRFNRLLFLLCLPGLAVILFQLLEERSDILKEHEQQARALALQISQLQRADINATKRLLTQLAKHDKLLKADNGQCSNLLKDASLITSNIANIGLVDLNGDVLCTVKNSTQRINIKDRRYFKTALKTQHFTIGQFQIDRSIHRLTVNFAMPIFDQNGSLTHILVVAKLLEQWSQSLSQLTLPPRSQAIITDADHNIVANYPFDYAQLGKTANEHWPDIDFKGIVQFEVPTGERRIYLRQHIVKSSLNDQLTLHISIPFEHAIAAANRKVGLTFVLFIAALLLLFWQARNQLNKVLLQPLKSLQNALDAFAKGNKTSLQQTALSPEFKNIAENFENMATQRLTAENALAHKHAELASLIRALPDTYLRIDKQGKVLASNVVFSRPPKQINDLIPQQSCDQLLKVLQTPSDIEINQFEFTSQIDGNQHIFEARTNLLDSHQQAIVVLRDITARKEQEEAMKLAAMVYKNSSEGMTITDENGTILDVNPSFEKVTGYSKAEVLGKNTALLASGKHTKQFYDDMWQQLQSKGAWQGEVINRRKNGELFTEWLTINTVYDSNGNPYQRVAIFTDISEKKRQDELIWRRTHFDQLTELANRLELKRHLKQQLSENVSLAILLLDLDHFKDINDSLGHYHGDKLLREVANRLNQLTGKCSLISRIGGDEFVLVISENSQHEHLMQVSEQVLTLLKPAIYIDNEACHISASIGIAAAPKDGNSSGQLLKAADQAMYLAKKQGRNGFAFFDAQMRQATEQRMQLLKDLRIAIQKQQFELYFQPIVDMASQKAVKAEALIRWQHPGKGIISPAVFIPLAEETQLILEIGEFIFASACRTQKKLMSAKHQVQLSINVSPIQFSSKHSRLVDWKTHLDELSLNAEQFVIEITEGLMMNAQQRTQSRLNQLSKQGFALALDDFGTGYSSLAYLKQMDTDFIKIDKRFVDGIADSADDLALCEAMIMMAHQLGLKVIAEGIETEAQHKQLLAAGCDYGQGYYYAKPMPEKVYLDFMNNATYGDHLQTD